MNLTSQPEWKLNVRRREKEESEACIASLLNVIYKIVRMSLTLFCSTACTLNGEHSRLNLAVHEKIPRLYSSSRKCNTSSWNQLQLSLILKSLEASRRQLPSWLWKENESNLSQSRNNKNTIARRTRVNAILHKNNHKCNKSLTSMLF